MQPRLLDFLPRLACLLALGFIASCSSLPHWMPGSTRYAPATIKADDYDKAMRIAREAQAAGEHAKALDWMLATRETEGLSPEQREASRVLLEEAAKSRVLELDRPGGDADALAEVSTYDLPRQIAVDAGLRAARRFRRKKPVATRQTAPTVASTAMPATTGPASPSGAGVGSNKNTPMNAVAACSSA